MSIAIGEDHEALLGTARRFTAERIPPAVVRAAVDGKQEGLPPFWDELTGLGWLGLAVPEDLGGQGYGIAELVVVLEELGRVVAPGPALTTAWVATVLGRHSVLRGEPAVDDAIADLVAGRRSAAVAFDADVTRLADGTVTVSATPVLEGGSADLLLAGSADSALGRGRWWLVDLSDAATTPVDALDPTRGLATVTATKVSATPLPLLERSQVEAVGTVLLAAEGCGVGSWCVDTAAGWARDRKQFGRPIGQFQGVKHRCANMLVALEQARALTWDAALELDDTDATGVGPPESIALGAVRSLVPDLIVDLAKDCIQVLGGIGFTWEHDAHLYLRRATAARQLFARTGSARRDLASAALAGARRHLTLDLPEDVESLRREIAALADDIAAAPREERRLLLADAGLIVPHWDPPWGRSASAVEQLVIDQELRRVKVRVPHLQVGGWAAPTIAAHGTVEQQERWVRPTLLGTIAWCQLFSEPEAGSDLAALTTTGTKTDGGWLLNGQKVWTSMAKEADWGICLVRTNPTAAKHLGITYVIVDMRSPGLDIRPLREMTGLEMFNEVFLDDVFVPDDCVIGEVDGGWPLARTTLANERVSMGSGASFGGGIEALLGLVGQRIESGDLDGEDLLLLDRVGALVAEAHSLAVLGLRTTLRSLTGAKPGSEASVRKLLGVEHDQRTQELGLTLLGPEGATTLGAAAQWTYGFLANRCLTIAGGTSEIQRNVIGERLLGLPRDP
ncbi:MAG: acyl-CoA dehydrogenase [Acidimicrobiales bacterium]